MALMTKRNFLIGGAVAVVGGIGAAAYRLKHPALVPLGYDFTADELTTARSLLEKYPSIDAHAHPGRTFVSGAENVSGMSRAAVILGSFESRSIGDMQAGGLTAAAFAAVADFQAIGFVGEGLAAVREFEPGEAWASYQRQIANLQQLVDSGLVYPVRSVRDFAAARKAGKPGALFTVEGGDFLEGRADRVAQSYADGVRSVTLMHYRTNELGDIITGTPVHNGITPAGIAVVKAMNTAGMLIDVAHASEATAFGIIKASSRPVMASHVHIHPAKAGGIDHPRFVSRDLALAVAETGGGLLGAWPAGIGITDLRGFVTRTFELVDAVGIDHVCMGTDMDANYKPVFDTYARLPHYVAGLLRGGMGEGDIAKLIGGNFLRIMTAVEPRQSV